MQTAAGQGRATSLGAQVPPRTCAHEVCLDAAVLDAAVFDALAAVLAPSVLAQIYREFLVQTQGRVEQLSFGSDTDLRRALAHTVKGTAGMLGARAVASCAEALEGARSRRDEQKTLAAMLAACAMLHAALREKRVLP